MLRNKKFNDTLMLLLILGIAIITTMYIFSADTDEISTRFNRQVEDNTRELRKDMNTFMHDNHVFKEELVDIHEKMEEIEFCRKANDAIQKLRQEVDKLREHHEPVE